MDLIADLAPFFLVAAFILLGVVLGLVVIVLRLTAAPASGATVPPVEVADPDAADFGDAPAAQRVYQTVREVSGAYQIAAHPAELRSERPFQIGVALLSGSDFSPAEVLRFAVGDNAVTSCMAFEAMRRREDTADAWREVLAGIGTLAAWAQFFALDYLAERAPADERLIGKVLASTTVDMENRLARVALEAFVRKRHEAGESLAFEANDIEYLNRFGVTALQIFLDRIAPTLGKPLKTSLDDVSRSDPEDDETPLADRGDILRAVGRIWAKADAAGKDEIYTYPVLAERVGEAHAVITSAQPQSVLLRGESGVGRTTLKRLLADRLVQEGWRVFAAGHGEILAGQVYIGMLEERLKRIIASLRRRKKAVWFVPDFDRFAFTGTHVKSDFSVMDAILPHIADGSLRIVADAEPAAFEKLTRKHPRVATVMAILDLKPADTDTAIEIARRWAATEKLQVSNPVLQEAHGLARQYLTERASPGNLMDLLKATRVRLAASGAAPAALSAEDVIVTLARQTGLPESLLDPRRELDLDGLESALSERVLGQEESVRCLVERVAMMKAGLADPSRPYGVFLFAGPTGTGKTEIAKALAAWLFGSADRLIRIDMSELQSDLNLERLLGTTNPTETKSLVDQIRTQPFSVVLLDEFEKAHHKVWDLFLQIFDDARITDRQGRTASFRNAIIILTANLGATIPTGLSIGFGSANRQFDEIEVRKAIARTFRREFINRLDRVIVFRPLDCELMRRILYRELRDVAERRGLKGRPWAIEWDESAIDFLLEKGFTPDLGARPLRRAIERYLLSPLAGAIVRNQFPEGDQFLFISCSGDGLAVEFVDPDFDEGAARLDTEAPTGKTAGVEGIEAAKAILLHPNGAPEDLMPLRTLLEEIEAEIGSDDWEARKQELFVRMNDQEFWSSPGRFADLGLLETVDRIEKSAGRARGLLTRIERHSERGRLPRRLLAILAQSVYLLATAREDVAGGRPGEAYLLVEARADGPRVPTEAFGFASRIADMYEAWARKRNMRLTRLARSNPGGSVEAQALYAITGFGAYSILEAETGLHVLERAGETPRDFRRDTVRVTVVPQPKEPFDGTGPETAANARRVIAEAGRDSDEVVRRYRETPSPLVRDLARDWRTGRLDLVLAGDFDLFT